jgi:hypothetical protein
MQIPAKPPLSPVTINVLQARNPAPAPATPPQRVNRAPDSGALPSGNSRMPRGSIIDITV